MEYQKLYLMQGGLDAKFRKIEVASESKKMYEVLLQVDEETTRGLILYTNKKNEIELLDDEMDKEDFKKITDAIHAKEGREFHNNNIVGKV